jgi:hypothetical protein
LKDVNRNRLRIREKTAKEIEALKNGQIPPQVKKQKVEPPKVNTKPPIQKTEAKPKGELIPLETATNLL